MGNPTWSCDMCFVVLSDIKILENESYASNIFNRWHLLLQIQWGSEYRPSLVCEWSKRGWMPNGLVFKCHLNTRQIDTILFYYVMVRYSNGGTTSYDITDRPAIWNPNFKKFSIQMVGYQIPTVIGFIQSCLISLELNQYLQAIQD